MPLMLNSFLDGRLILLLFLFFFELFLFLLTCFVLIFLAAFFSHHVSPFLNVITYHVGKVGSGYLRLNNYSFIVENLSEKVGRLPLIDLLDRLFRE